VPPEALLVWKGCHFRWFIWLILWTKFK